MIFTEEQKKILLNYQKNINQIRQELVSIPLNIPDKDTFCQLIIQSIKNKELPEEIIIWFIRLMQEDSQSLNEYKSIIQNRHNVPIEEAFLNSRYFKEGQLNPEQTINTYENIFRYHQIIKIIHNKQENNSIQEDVKLFNSSKKDEFSISRLIADPINNVPRMLDKFNIPCRINENEDLYITQSEDTNSLGDKIRLEYKFRASSKEEAEKQAKSFIKRINGRPKKTWEACWAKANMLLHRIVRCDLTDIMIIAYPGRNKESFTTKEKLDFFTDMLDLSATAIILEKNKNNFKKNKPKTTSFIMPLITILETSTYDLSDQNISNRYPNSLTYSVLYNPLYENEKMYSVGAPIKIKTLELCHDDIQLAEYIQVRKSQRMKEKFITFTDRSELFNLANISGIKHIGMANKKLKQKFQRFYEKGIILSYPDKICFPIKIKIR